MTGEPSISDRGTEEEVKVNFLYRGVDWALDWQRGQLSMELHGRVAASIPKVSGTLPLFTVLGLLVVWGLHQLADTGLGHFWALGGGAASGGGGRQSYPFPPEITPADLGSTTMGSGSCVQDPGSWIQDRGCRWAHVSVSSRVPGSCIWILEP